MTGQRPVQLKSVALVLGVFLFASVALSLGVYILLADKSSEPSPQVEGEGAVVQGQVQEPIPEQEGYQSSAAAEGNPQLGPDGQEVKVDPYLDQDARPDLVVHTSAEGVVPFPESAEARALLDTFRLLGQGQITEAGYEADPALWNVVEQNYSGGIIPPGLDAFYRHVMTKGPWEVKGNPIQIAQLTEPVAERGRVKVKRSAYLLVHQSVEDRWYQVMVRADFLSYPDGRVLISQMTLGAPEISELDPELVPKYLAAHGV